MRQPVLLSLLACALSIGCADELDYYKTSVYPGAHPRSDVDAPTVVTRKAPPGELARREVTIWPRKGMDTIPVKNNMPLRTWTFRSGLGSQRIWGRKPGVPEAGKDPSYREAYWDRLCSYDSNNIRAGLLMVSVRGYLIPPKSGRYTFYYAADDRGCFFLSSDENPENAEPLAYNKEYARKGNYYFRGPEQISRVLKLEGGKKYYFEATFEDMGGGCWMSVGWSYQGRLFPEVIDGQYLESLDGTKGFAKADYYEPGGLPKSNPLASRGTLRAHLIGFRGVGHPRVAGGEGNPVAVTIPWVVLRLPDGRKRTFNSSLFSAKDQAFLEKAYAKAYQQLYDASDKTPHKLMRAVDMTQNVKPGQPGMLNAETDHMSWYAGSQSAPGFVSPWVNEPDLEAGRIYREALKAWGESMWLTQEYAGHPMYTWREPLGRQSKYEVTVAGTMKNGYEVIRGFAGGGRGACVAAGGKSGIVAHEWGHGAGMGFGGEGGCDTFATFDYPGPRGCSHLKNASYRNFHAADDNLYGMVSFGTLWGDDPNWGQGFHIVVPRGQKEADLSFTFSRILEQRGMAKEGDGIRAFGDLAGEYLARLATLDYELEFDFSNEFYMPSLSLVERIDPDRPLYRIHTDHEPEACGVNIIRLNAEPGAKEIAVDFQGLIDPETHSDWRACIVAVGKNGVRRYSKLWNKGLMSLAILPDDASHFLTVTATPSALTAKTNRHFQSKGLSPTGRHGMVYPWQAEITGAIPGTSTKRLGDLGNIETSYSGPLLAPRRTATAQIEKLKTYYAHLQKIVATRPTTQKEAQLRFVAMLNMTSYRTAMDMLQEGKPHPRGGGWVADTASVAETAYVGPRARVMGYSTVRDNAVIEDTAVILGRSDISGHAKVSGGAVLASKSMDGYARCWDEVQDIDGHVRELPMRARWNNPHPDGLWANYAMNGDGGIRLNDYFRHDLYDIAGIYVNNKTQYHVPFGISLHGAVHGQPKYVKIDGRWGMRIDNPSQYATLNPRTADLGAITLAMTLRREKAVAGTLLDLGSNKNNCMVLALNKKGQPKFVAIQNGKTVVTLSSKRSIPLNQWASVRVELDGSLARLVVNGASEASVKTTFRPCDVYLPDVPRQNFLGNSRRKDSPMIGVLDELVVYSRVNKNFDSLLPPVVNCPIRPTEGALEAVTAYSKFVHAHNEKIKEARAKAKQVSQTKPDDPIASQAWDKSATHSLQEQKHYYWKLLPDRIRSRRKELTAISVDTTALEAKLKAVQDKCNTATKKAKEEAKALPEVIALSAKHKEMETLWRAEQKAWHRARSKAYRDDSLWPQLDADLNAFLAKMKTENLKRDTDLWRKRHRQRRKLDNKRRLRERYLSDKLKISDARWVAFWELQDAYYQVGRRIRNMADSYVKRETRELLSEIGDLKAKIAQAQREARAPYAPEFKGLDVATGLYRGYYNVSVQEFLGGQGEQDRGVVGILPGTDNPEHIRELLGVLPNTWHTEVDWDWRIREEVDGRIKNLPLLQKWLARVRGPVVTQEPVGSNPNQSSAASE